MRGCHRVQRSLRWDGLSNCQAFVQVSRTGRVRVKPLAFWANQRLSRDALAIDQGFSDQLARQCRGASLHSPPKASPIKGQPTSADRARDTPAALQKAAKSVRSWICGCLHSCISCLHAMAAECLEAFERHVGAIYWLPWTLHLCYNAEPH